MLNLIIVFTGVSIFYGIVNLITGESRSFSLLTLVGVIGSIFMFLLGLAAGSIFLIMISIVIGFVSVIISVVKENI